jgi:hypothetical protein
MSTVLTYICAMMHICVILQQQGDQRSVTTFTRQC